MVKKKQKKKARRKKSPKRELVSKNSKGGFLTTGSYA